MAQLEDYAKHYYDEMPMMDFTQLNSNGQSGYRYQLEDSDSSNTGIGFF